MTTLPSPASTLVGTPPSAFPPLQSFIPLSPPIRPTQYLSPSVQHTIAPSHASYPSSPDVVVIEPAPHTTPPCVQHQTNQAPSIPENKKERDDYIQMLKKRQEMLRQKLGDNNAVVCTVVFG